MSLRTLRSFAAALLTALFSGDALAAEPDPGSSAGYRNGVELNLIWPLVPRIFQVKYNRQVLSLDNGMQGEFITSANFRPWTFVEGEGEKLMVAPSLGYRHFWWRGLNTELSIYPELIWLRDNVVDGERYWDFVLIPELYAGYKGYFGASRFFYNVQVGTGVVAYRMDPWPKTVEDDVFFNGNLTVGVSF